jgi:cytoskeletal protein CcmA (bactofilin family)
MIQFAKTIHRRGCFTSNRIGVMLLLICIALLLPHGNAHAAEVRGGAGQGAIFRLPAGQVIKDDLYVAAGEIYIDGTVEGDLVAAGGYIEVNGTVTGDALLAGGGITINGIVQDDARLAGGGVNLAGKIGGDLFAAGGGPVWANGPAFPIVVNGRSIAQGVQLQGSATVGGDAYMVGGQGIINGAVARDLFAGMGRLVFAGNVQRNAQLYAQDLQVRETSKVKGILRYRSQPGLALPAGVAGTVQPDQPVAPAPPPTPGVGWVWQMITWVWRTVLLSLGFALLAWLLWHFVPNLFTSTVQRLESQPLEVSMYGLVAAALLFPVAAALVFLVGIFWGWLAAGALFALLFGVTGLLWLFSPLVSGYWVGRRLAMLGYQVDPLAALIVGALVIVLVARVVSLIPYLGPLVAGVIYMVSFALTLGSLIAAQRQRQALVPEA